MSNSIEKSWKDSSLDIYYWLRYCSYFPFLKNLRAILPPIVTTTSGPITLWFLVSSHTFAIRCNGHQDGFLSKFAKYFEFENLGRYLMICRLWIWHTPDMPSHAWDTWCVKHASLRCWSCVHYSSDIEGRDIPICLPYMQILLAKICWVDNRSKEWHLFPFKYLLHTTMSNESQIPDFFSVAD